MGASGSTPRLRRKNSPGEGSDTSSRKSKNSSDGSIKPLQEKDNGKTKTDDRKSKKENKLKNKFSFGGSAKKSEAPIANIDSDSEEGAQSYLESDEVDYHTPPQPRKDYSLSAKEVGGQSKPNAIQTNVREGLREEKEINCELIDPRRTALNDINKDSNKVKDFNSSKDLTGAAALVEKALTLDNNLTRFARDKISMLEATKTEQEIVINKLQTEVVKLKEKVRHLCKLRQDLLEQRSQVEDRVRSVQRERDHDISTRDSRIRELEDELEQYECKMEYLEHTQVHLQRSLLASENKTPKLLEELQKISADLADCKSDLKEKNQRIHELANSVMTKEAMIERLQNDLKAFKKEAAQEMEKRFLLYTEEKERLMSQLQEETEEYVKAAFAEKDCQLRELNEDWQNKYDQLNEKLSSLRKELEDAIAEKNDLLMSRDAGSSDDEDEDDDGSGEDSTDSTSSASELDWQVQERVERFREELTRIHSINTIEQRTAHEKQLGEVRDKLEQKITLLKKQHEEELREFDQLLNDELNRVHKKYQAELRRLREQVSSSPDCGTGVIKTDKGVQAFIGRSFSSSASSANAQEYLEDSEKLAEFKLQLSEVQDQLRQKQDEVIKVRTEASNQIRNVELYWQERLNKEIKELNMARENELADIRHECNKQVKQLTDKINSLQTIMKLTGQDQPLVTPIVEEPSSGEEDLEATDEDVESFEEVDGDADDTEDDEANGDGDEEGEVEIEEIIEEIIELSPCAQRVTALRHNPLSIGNVVIFLADPANFTDEFSCYGTPVTGRTTDYRVFSSCILRPITVYAYLPMHGKTTYQRMNQMDIDVNFHIKIHLSHLTAKTART